MRHTPAMSSAPRARVGPYRWADFVALADHDRRELIDGELVEVDVPTLAHERVITKLLAPIDTWTERHGGMVLPSGYKIRISERRGVMPDIQVYFAGNEPDIEQNEGLVRGRPDLAVEVISPTSRRYDRIVKLGYYLAIAVPEYWLVDPEARTLERFLFTKKGYVIGSVHEEDAVLRPPTFRGLKIALSNLWLRPAKRPPPKRARRR